MTSQARALASDPDYSLFQSPGQSFADQFRTRPPDRAESPLLPNDGSDSEGHNHIIMTPNEGTMLWSYKAACSADSGIMKGTLGGDSKPLGLRFLHMKWISNCLDFYPSTRSGCLTSQILLHAFGVHSNLLGKSTLPL